jgi:hypothetical protein
MSRTASDSRTRSHLLLFGAIAVAGLFGAGDRGGIVEAQGGGCGLAASPIACENALTGDTDWDITGSGSDAIQGFATDMSVNIGQTIQFKIDTAAASYDIPIYRLGYYGGTGARRVATVAPSASLPQTQPSCASEPATGLVDCGTWAVSASWPVPGDAVSGIYIAKPTLPDGSASHIVFVVRDDNRKAALLFQTSDTTWQAYNRYGGNSTYCGQPFSNAGTGYGCAGRAVKASYNRPFDTRAHNPTSWLFNAESPMVRWIEANGYDVKYWSGLDTDRRGGDLVGPARPNIFLSVGHDEYWSGNQRARVEAARAAGVNLAFFSGNEMFWKHRWEPGIAGSNAANRTLVVYKETLAGEKIDPSPEWTGTWRDPRFSPPADGGRPENALTGTLWTVNCCSYAITVPEPLGKMRFWRGTPMATLVPGQVGVLAPDTLGYEWDENIDNGFRPAGLLQLSLTTTAVPEKLTNFGGNIAPGTATHSLTLYRHTTRDESGNIATSALVFGAGTVQWSWGLDGHHDRGPSVTDPTMRQATVNLFADMGAQPSTLQAGLVLADPSPDSVAPSSTIIFPSSGSTVQAGSRLTITGTASDQGGAVAAMEVSVDGGGTWHQAQGRTAWTYDWTPGALGEVILRSRAVDDTGNVQGTPATVTVNVAPGACPCTSLWDPATTTPSVPDAADGSAVNLGVKFRSDIDGFITGMRFYKSSSNVGTHVATLWTLVGSPLATATFTNETPSGWQQVTFSSPVPIIANAAYVASYHTNVGHYAATSGYFNTSSVERPPLHSPATGLIGGNGAYKYGPVDFPNNTFNGTNYWVDVVFAPSLDDDDRPIVSNIKAVTIDSSKAIVTWATNEEATSRIDYSTDPAILTDLGILPSGTLTVSEGSFVTEHRLVIDGLTSNTTYYYRITSADRAGNPGVAIAPSFTVPGPTLRDSVTADFAAGSGVGTYVSETGDGELMLAPAIATEFSGSAMPAGWLSVLWGAGGSAFVANGTLLVDGTRVGSCTPTETGCVEQGAFGPGRSLEFSANFTGDAFQHSGLAVTLEGAPWAIFSTSGGGTLWARTMSEAGVFINTALGNQHLGALHRYRIDWKPASVDFYIDGALAASHGVAITGPMRPLAASDFSVYGGYIVVDWMRLGPYAATGAFVSRVFDAGAPVTWRSANWDASAAAGATLQVSVRTADALDVDGSVLAPWTPVESSGLPFNATSRYVQYRAEFATGDPAASSALHDIIISTDSAPVAVDDAITAAQNTTSTFPPSGPTSLTFNDTDFENDPLSITAVTPAAHGTVTLNANGSVSYAPQLNYNGPDSFSYTVSDGLLASSAVVTLNVAFANSAPVANNNFYSAVEEQTLTVGSAGVLANDTDVEGDALAAVLDTQALHGSVVLAADGSFTYTPVPNYAGPDQFSYRAHDGKAHGNAATVSLEVAQVNDAPLASADTFTMVRNQVLAAAAPGVLANDRDIEVEDIIPLTAEHVPGSGPLHGTLTMAADGSFTYQPSADYIGVDSFAYRVRDHFGAISAPAIVSIKVDVKAVVDDVAAGETLATGSTATAANPVQSAVTSPSAATLVISQGVIAASQPPAGYTFLNQQVNIAALNADGSDTTGTLASPLVISFVLDHTLVPPGENEGTVEVFRNGVLIPDCLGAAGIPSSSLDPCIAERIAIDGDVRFTVLTTHASAWNVGVSTASYGAAPYSRDDGYIGPAGSPLLVPAPGVLGNDFGGNSLSAAVVTGPASGTLVLSPTGGFTFAPAPGYSGTESFTYVASDGTTVGMPATVTLVITPVNQAPVFMKGADQTVVEDAGPQTVAGWATGIGPGAASEDGQLLTFITSSDNPGLFSAAPAVSPDGTLRYTPAPDANGVAAVRVRLTDNGGVDNGGVDTSAEQTFGITLLAVADGPTDLTAAITSAARITLNWVDTTPDETRFLVLRAVNGGAFSQVGAVTRTAVQSAATGGTATFASTGLAAGTTYSYKVVAELPSGPTEPSNTVTLLFSPAPELTLTPAALTFAAHGTGMVSASQMVNVKNTGVVVMNLTNLALTGADAEQFLFASSCGATLNAGASCAVSIRFAPATEGSKGANLSVSVGAPAVSGSVALSGTAFGLPAVGSLRLGAPVIRNQGPNSAVVTPAFAVEANTLVVAFIAADAAATGTNVFVSLMTNPTGAALKWTRAVRSNVQRGTAEIWSAFSTTAQTLSVRAAFSQNVPSSITVVPVTGADTTLGGAGAIGASLAANAATGVPTATLQTTRANSWVLGIGDDWWWGHVMTPGPDQVIINQYMPKVDDVYWVQRTLTATPDVGGVTLDATYDGPMTDRWNMALVEIREAVQ